MGDLGTGVTLKGFKVSFWDNEKVLELTLVMAAHTLHVCGNVRSGLLVLRDYRLSLAIILVLFNIQIIL